MRLLPAWLRPAAWRGVWGALKSNPVYAARFAHLAAAASTTS
jgi:hypothetical protein